MVYVWYVWYVWYVGTHIMYIYVQIVYGKLSQSDDSLQPASRRTDALID